MSKWWQQDMSDAGQGLFADPNLALQVATMPPQVLAAQQAYDKAARDAKGGFMQQTMASLGAIGKSVDGALSKVPGWGVAKEFTKATWYPVDKAASGAYWLYSNVISQPLSTAFLVAAKSDLGTGSYFDGDTWSEAYHKAEHISPAQAFANYENVAEVENPTMLSGFFGGGADKLNAQEKEDVKRNTDRFLYDTEYWRKKTGWQYTIGTGALDLATSMGADPAYAGIKVVSGAVKGARTLKVAGVLENQSRSVSGVNILADKAANAIGNKLAKTPEEISRNQKMNDFFNWSEGKSGAEIAQHPIWGRGRRVNPAAPQLSDIFAQADSVEKPLIMRFAMGDNEAASQLAQKNSDLMSQIGRMSDNRQLVDSAKFNPAIFAHFTNEEAMGRTAPGAIAGPGIGGTSEGVSKGGQIMEPPHPRPTGNTPGIKIQQQGWDATYGKLAEQSALYRQAAGDILKSGNGVRPMGAAAENTSLADSLKFDSWKADKLQSIDHQLTRMDQKQGFYQGVLGSLEKGVEDFSPGESNIFGTVKQAYRQGPLALRDTGKAADRKIYNATVDRVGRKADGGFIARTIRQGYYTVPLRVVQSFGDRIPQGFINHNDADAPSTLLDMLKQVPGLGQEERLGMLNQYSMAGDKVSRSKALDEIHTNIVHHLASRVHNLDPMVASQIDDMVKVGVGQTMADLTGANVARDPMFNAAKVDAAGNPVQPGAQGHRADKYEDGDGWKIAPNAVTQLKYSEPLLDVKELDRAISRSKSFIGNIRNAGGDAIRTTASVADTFNNVWKAATLLRPGYVVRAPSEEIVASAIKFGLVSMMADGSRGSGNWILNRGQQLKAIVGKGSYVPGTGKMAGSNRAVVRIQDEAAVRAAEAQGLPTTRVRVNDQWPFVQKIISNEKASMEAAEKGAADMEKLRGKDGFDQAKLDDFLEKSADHRNVMEEHVDYANEMLRQATDASGRRLGEGTIEHNGIEVPQAFSKQWDNPIARDQISSSSYADALFARNEGIQTARMIKTGTWVGVEPGAANHMESWLGAINKQWKQDKLFRLVAEDPTLKKASDWLKTAEGRAHRAKLGGHGKDPERLVNGVKATLDQYLPVSQLQEKLAKGVDVTETELRQAIHKDDFPVVHGEETKGLTAQHGAETAARLVDNLINKGFEMMGTIPTDILSRHPTYLRAQEARMRTLIDQELSYQKSVGKAGDSIHPDQLNKMLEKSDKLARKDISQVVYDPTRTTATQALRFVTPFLSAHVDGLERWAGLVAEKPQFVTKAAKIYNAPVASNLVTDSEGNHVDQNGYATVVGADGKTHKKFVGIEDRVLHLRVPNGTTGVKELSSGIPLKIQALNTILPGDPWWNPGSGPMVQIAASEIAKASPSTGDFLQWAKVLPYGPTGFIDSVTPKYMKNLWEAFHSDSEGYQQATLQAYQKQVAEYHDGGPPPDMNRAKKEAKQFYYLKALTSWASPAQTQMTPLTGTPYQFYVDQYKKLKDLDPKTADDSFLSRYGADYFVFTASLSKSMGIAPTASAVNASREMSDLIAGDSSLAPFIIGDTYNQGKFSSSAYYDQMNETIGGEKVRGKVSVEQALEDNQKRLGWSMYTKMKDGLDAALIRTGFTSYTQAGAENFLALKQQMQQGLSEMLPAWEQDFNTTDRGLVARRIKSFEILVQDKRLKDDPMRQDIPALTQYLMMRQQFKSALNARGSSSLSFNEAGSPTGANADIANSWRAYQFGLVSQNTKFASVFNRYLSNDDLQ